MSDCQTGLGCFDLLVFHNGLWCVFGGEDVTALPGIQACCASLYDIALVCGRFLQGTGLIRK